VTFGQDEGLEDHELQGQERCGWIYAASASAVGGREGKEMGKAINLGVTRAP